MDRYEARSLWTKIIEFSEAIGEVMGEGNSGEFHDDNRKVGYEKDALRSAHMLAKDFHSKTGFHPYLRRGGDPWDSKAWTV
jgi:hypothetical protein